MRVELGREDIQERGLAHRKLCMRLAGGGGDMSGQATNGAVDWLPKKLARLAPTLALIRAFIRRLFHLFPPGRSNGAQLTRLVLTTCTRSVPRSSCSKKQTPNRLHQRPELLGRQEDNGRTEMRM